ncbi:Dyp-type peroxidase [Agrococcus jejuensis]|uniref:Dye decolorizing peroxidase n=1 Tax=Agrococcus jejuensis TaxID=399736 RepID=A0A1G8DJB6_9MICO|nr:Dyp-type peroxidase [Agrococcus jejuensis]SDH57569.1 dye decolorizing peroxidase [Agrococcus jejuensis]
MRRRDRAGADAPADDARRGLSRRQLLLGGAVAGAGAAAAIGADAVARVATAAPAAPAELLHGDAVVPFHGAHQAAFTIPPQAHATMVALDLLPETDAEGLRRLLRILSDDASRLTQGEAALADSEPELALVPARLTATIGLGPAAVALAGAAVPTWLAPLPAFAIDALEDAWSGGDLLLEVAGDDPLTVAHAQRMLLKGTRSFARIRWVQSGFRRSHGAEAQGTTMRNLFGQVDGTVNPQPGDADFDGLVFIRDGWLAGGTSLVVRRIRMDLDTWDRLDRPGREQSVGRTLANGAPLTGTREHDEPDFAALTPIGFPVIPEFSHMRRARSDDPSQRFHRRAFNYDERPAGASVSESGMLFTAAQADPLAQFVPIQQRLSDLDLLNEWTTPIGSAVFAIPPGCEEGGFVGETLFG